MTAPTPPRHAVVSGGATGIGLGIAAGLIADGLTVTLLGRNAERLAEACSKLGPQADAQRADVSQRADCEAAVAAVAAKHGSIDVLVNNAGVMKIMNVDTPLDKAEAVWDKVHSINLRGAFLLSVVALPKITAPGGRIIHIGSLTAANGGSEPAFLAYAAAKAGMEGLMRAMANELGPRGITVNTVAPGVILDTQISARIDRSAANPVLQTVPVRRLGVPADVASAVSWLASPGAGFVTGVVVPVNGGQHLR